MLVLKKDSLSCRETVGQSVTNISPTLTYGFIVIYLLCSIAAPVLLRRRGETTAEAVVFGALGAVLMALSLIGSLYPLPAYTITCWRQSS